MNKGKYITPKKEDLERRFNEYNEKYFDGVLPPCKLMVAKSEDGCPAWYFKSKIYIARNVYWTDEQLKLSIIHEMVHHYISTIIGYEPRFCIHGRTFRKVCRMLRKKHGLRVNLWELKTMEGKKKNITLERDDVSLFIVYLTFLK